MKKKRNYIEGNIIQIHIPTGKNIDRIFSTTKEYLIKNNDSLIKKDFSSNKNDAKILISFYIKEKLEKKSLTSEEKKKYKELYKLCNNIVVDFKKKCSLIYNLEILLEKSKVLKTVGIIGMINNIAINYGFGQKDLYDYGLDKYIYERDKNEKFDNEQIQKLEKKCKSLLEDILYYTGPIQCLIKAKEFTHQIINLIDELSNKNENDWNTFQVEKI